MKIGLTPCPNDTFLFNHWHDLSELEFHDIEQLNALAISGKYDVTKISAALYPAIKDTYRYLSVGAVFGYGSGPKIIAKNQAPIESMHIAVPGPHTTAYALLNHFFSPRKITHMSYDKIVPSILSGECDAGLIIHETRFTYESYGLVELVDFGKLYYETYKLPIPLGLFVIKKSLPDDIVESFTAAFTESILKGRSQKNQLSSFITSHAQEASEDIIQKHIDFFVTDETISLSPQGKHALTHFFSVVKFPKKP